MSRGYVSEQGVGGEGGGGVLEALLVAGPGSSPDTQDQSEVSSLSAGR